MINIDNILTIDAGNSRVKWGVFDATGTMQESGACLHAELSTTNLPRTHKVIISNVAGIEMHEKLKHILSGNATIQWIRAQSTACNVINRYATPENLGSDRWAALIAAWHIKQTPCVVVNAGTAVTIDALSSQQVNNQPCGEFIGGLILPGLNLMQQSLGIATAQLPKIDASVFAAPEIPREIFAKNTAEAIFTGTLHAISGAIEHMAHELNLQSKQVPRIVISGGDAKVIKDAIAAAVTNPIAIVDNLVLQGLYLLEKSTPI